MNDRKNEVLVN